MINIVLPWTLIKTSEKKKSLPPLEITNSQFYVGIGFLSDPSQPRFIKFPKNTCYLSKNLPEGNFVYLLIIPTKRFATKHSPESSLPTIIITGERTDFPVML